jgi:three-Cys-motif partner protein
MKESQLKLYQHSEVKVRLLRLYLERYLNILTYTPYFKDILVYDLFCGEGIYEEGGKGSPIIILETINTIHNESKSRNGKTGHFHCTFNDFEGEKVDKLEAYINDKKLFSKEIGEIEFKRDDYKELLPKVLEKLSSLGKEKAFIFIDPYGYKDISVKNIRQLLSSGKTEVLLFLPTQFMFRFENKGTPESLKQFINELVPVEIWPKSETGIEFIENLRDAFREAVGEKVFVDSFIITRDKNQFFCLFFFTSHIYGFDRMLDTKWQIDADEGRGWYYEELSLFNQVPKKPNTIKFEKKLISFLRDTHKTNGQIYEFTIRNGHLTSHANDILRKIQTDGHLEVKLKDGTLFTGRSFFINYQEYRDNYDRIRLKIK